MFKNIFSLDKTFDFDDVFSRMENDLGDITFVNRIVSKDFIFIKIGMPGYSVGDIKVEALGGVLLTYGKGDDKTVVKVQVPLGCTLDDVEAVLENGMLTLKFTKIQPKKIIVKEM